MKKATFLLDIFNPVGLGARLNVAAGFSFFLVRLSNTCVPFVRPDVGWGVPVDTCGVQMILKTNQSMSSCVIIFIIFILI